MNITLLIKMATIVGIFIFIGKKKCPCSAELSTKKKKKKKKKKTFYNLEARLLKALYYIG